MAYTETAGNLRMHSISIERVIAIMGAVLGAVVTALKIWKVFAPKYRAWIARRAAAKAFLETGLAKLEDIATRQAQIELTMSFAHSVGEMTLMLVGVAAWKSNLDGSATFIAPALSDLMGLDQSRAQGNGWVSAVHPSDRRVVFEEYRSAIQERRVFSAWFRYQHDDGHVVHVHGLAYPAANPITGQVHEYWGRAQEITKEEWVAKRSGKWG